MRQEITEMFDTLEDEGCDFIDKGYDGERLINAIESEKESLAKTVEHRIGIIINKELTDLHKNIEYEIRSLRESFGFSNINSNFTASFNMNLGKMIDQLNFKFEDLINWGMYLGGSVMIVVAIANEWNPIGWILTAIGGLIAIFDDSKEDKAKAKFRESIGEAKNELLNTKWSKMTSEIDLQFRYKANDFDRKMKSIIEDFKAIKTQMNTVVNDIKFSSIRLRFLISLK